MTTVKRLLLGLLTAALIVSAGLAVVIGTEFGARALRGVLIRTVAGFDPGTMTGTLLRLRLEGARLSVPGFTFSGNVSWRIDAGKLLSGKLEIAEIELSEAALSVQSAALSPKAADEPAQKRPAARLQAPLDVHLGRLSLRSVSFDIDGNLVDIASFETSGAWRRDRLTIDSMRVRDVGFAPADSGTPAPNEPTLGEMLERTFAEPLLPTVAEVNLPLDVELKTFELTSLRLRDQPEALVESVRFSLSAADGQIKLEAISARSNQAEVNATLLVGLNAPHEICLDARLAAVVSRESIPTGEFPKADEPTTEDVENFYERLKQARAQQLQAARNRRTKSASQTAARRVLDTGKLTQAERREQNRRLREQIKHRLERWRASVRGLLPSPQPLPPVTVMADIRMRGFLAGELTLEGELQNVPGVRQAFLSLKTNASQAGLPLLLEANAQGVDISGITLGAPRLKLEGRAVDYALTFTSRALYRLDEQNTLQANVRVLGKGTETQAHFTDFALSSNIGELRIEAQADWKREPRFAASLSLNDIDTSSIAPQNPLRVSGTLAAWGERRDGRWQAKLHDLTVLGDLRGHSLALTGAAGLLAEGIVEIPELYFAVGKNSLEFSGRADLAEETARLDFKGEVDAPDFSLLDPNLRGSIKGNFAVTGSAQLPVINTDMTARNIVYSSTSLKRVRLTGRMRSRDVVSGRIKLELDELKTDSATVHKATLEAAGSELRHRISLNLNGSPVSLQAEINGLYERMLGNWAGALSVLKISSDYGPLSLEKPLRMSYVSALKRLNLATACLTHPDARVCLRNALRVDLSGQSELRVLLELDKFDLAFVRHYLKGNFEAQGILRAQADMTLPAGLADLPSGKITVSGKNIRTNYRMQLSDWRMGLDELKLSFANTRDSVTAHCALSITDNGSLEGTVHIGDVFASRTLKGTVRLNHIDTTLFNSFLSPGESAEGEIHGDLRLGGTLEEPLLFGKAGIRNARLDSTKLPFEMLPSEVLLQFAGNTSTLNAQFKTPKGEVAFTGQADWKTLQEARAVVSAEGSRLRVTLPPSIELDLSTRARCEVSSERIRLDGLISVPWARVRVTELPASAVEVSEDVVRTDRPRPQHTEDARAIAIESRLAIAVGEDVRVEAMGLKARLTGNLAVVQNKSSLGLTGQISVPSGSFKAYGQNLIVRRGEFHFIGEASNPLIDLEAIRNPDNTADNVTAGIRITGSANYPQVKVFSDPATSETEAMSYLIRGEGLDLAGDSDNTMITSALINLGLSQGSQAFKSLGDAIGISGLGLETEGVGDSSQLVVSGYVLPGLKVKYGVGIFDSLATLTLRYRVIPKLYIEAASGVDQALDLLYAFEF